MKKNQIKQIKTYNRSCPDPNDIKFQCSCGEIFCLAECENCVPKCPKCGTKNKKAYKY